MSLILRDWHASDRDDIVRACNDPETSDWLEALPKPYTLDDADFFISDSSEQARLMKGYRFAVARGPAERVLGAIGMSVDAQTPHIGTIGYWTAPWARRQGVARQACNLIVEWAKGSTDVVRFQAQVDPANAASRGVIEAAGFNCEGLQRSVLAGRKGVLRDMLIYARIEPTRK